MHSEPASLEDDENDVSDQIQKLRSSAMSAPRNTTSSQMSVRPDLFGSKQIRLPEINRGLLQGQERYAKSKYASTPKVVLSGQKEYEIYERLNEEDNSPKQIQHANTDANQSRQHIKQSKTDQKQPTSRLSSLLGRIRKDRKESEEELQIIENRVKMLKKEEEKTQKKTEQIRQKSEDIAQIKQRHAFEIQKREDTMKEEADKIALAKENAQKKKEKAKHLDNLGELLLRNHEMYVQTKREKELSRMIISQMTQKEIDENAKHVRKMRKKQAAAVKKIKEQKAGVEKIMERFQEDIQTEAQLKWEKDQKILKLEENEQILIKKLQKSRNIQRQSIMHLQEITQLKPSDVIAKTSKQNTPANNKMPGKIFNLSQRDVIKDKDVVASAVGSRKGSQSVKGNRRRVYSVEQPLDGNSNSLYFKADKLVPKTRLVASQQLKVHNQDVSPEKQESIQEIIDVSNNKSGEFHDNDINREHMNNGNTGSTPQSLALTTHLSEDNNFIQNHPESFQSPQSRRNIDHKLFLSSGIKEEMKKYENLHKSNNINHKENNFKSTEDIILHKIYDQMPGRIKQLSLIESTQDIPKKKKKRSRSIPDISPENNNKDHDINGLNILLPTEITDNEMQKKQKKATRKLRASSKTSKREQKQASPSVYLQPTFSPFGGLNPAQIKFLFQVARRKPSPYQPTKAFQDISVSKPDMVF